MTTMYATKNTLRENVRVEVAGELNAVLADAIDLSLQAKQAHWNVKGPQFMQLHELFDQVHTESVGWVDMIAERAVQLGGVATGTLQSVAANTRLPEYGIDISDGDDHVDALSSAVGQFGGTVRDAISAAEGAGDADTADLFTEVSRAADKMLWFIEAHSHTGA